MYLKTIALADVRSIIGSSVRDEYAEVLKMIEQERGLLTNLPVKHAHYAILVDDVPNVSRLACDS
jgi:hypothetical protein